jgi:hypothetical protein
MKKRKYILYLAMCRAEGGSEEYQVLFRMIGQVPRARIDGKFRSPDQLVDHFKIAEATGALVELALQLDNLSTVLQKEDLGEGWRG